MSLEQAAALTERQVVELQAAYAERIKWETRVQAVATVNALGEAMTPKQETMSLAGLAALGFKVMGNADWDR
jgi:hypothetical protein